MKRLLKPLSVAALVVAAALPALADIAPPRPADNGNANVKTRKSVPARMQLRPDAEAKEAKLIIPRAVLQHLRADLDGNNDPNAAAATAPRGLNLTPTQTAFAGVFLSLSLVFGGVWLLNSRGAGRKTARAVVAVAVVALSGAAGAAVYANAGPPAYARTLTSRILVPETTYYGGPYGNVKVEITDEIGDYIELRLPKWKDGRDDKGDE